MSGGATRASDVSAGEEMVAFYHELGLAISQWAALEVELWFLVAKDMTKKQMSFISHGYYSIQVFHQKLQFINGLLTKSLKRKKDIERWHRLSKRLMRCAEQRNKLAHRPVFSDHAAAPGRRIGLTKWLSKSRPSDNICVLDVVRIR